MIRFERLLVLAEQTAEVVCNLCGKPCPDPHGLGAEYATIKASWGYGSPKDGDQHEAHLCEPCYDAHLAWRFTIDPMRHRELIKDGKE